VKDGKKYFLVVKFFFFCPFFFETTRPNEKLELEWSSITDISGINFGTVDQ
jgi:hypothetical protein